MKTIIQEAIEAFEFEHEFRNCKDKKKHDKSPCQHKQLIERAKNYEKGIENKIAYDIAVRIAEVRDSWLDKPNIREGSYAAFIESVFGVAIKMLEEIK